MPPNIEDKGYLWDVLDACNDIISFTRDKSYEDFSTDKMTRFAVERQLIVIGEASKKISEDLREMYSNIPWKRVIGLRNVIAHEYGEILIERVWRIAKTNVPILQSQIKEILE